MLHLYIIEKNTTKGDTESIVITSFYMQIPSSLLFAGTEWHPKISLDRNIVSNIDMPRFVLDSFDVCRFPPQLSKLDQ